MASHVDSRFNDGCTTPLAGAEACRGRRVRRRPVARATVYIDVSDTAFIQGVSREAAASQVAMRARATIEADSGDRRHAESAADYVDRACRAVLSTCVRARDTTRATARARRPRQARRTVSAAAARAWSLACASAARALGSEVTHDLGRDHEHTARHRSCIGRSSLERARGHRPLSSSK